MLEKFIHNDGSSWGSPSHFMAIFLSNVPFGIATETQRAISNFCRKGPGFHYFWCMEVTIRKEVDKDHIAVFELIQNAFENQQFSDHKEHYLVERLRNSEAFVPELSLIAEANDQIVGYILLTKINIIDVDAIGHTSLALAPIAVLQAFQGLGIGGRLMDTAHKRAKALGFGSVVLLGHENYYPRFGYKKAKEFEINLPFDVPEANCMAIELIDDSLKNIKGIVQYPKEFEID